MNRIASSRGGVSTAGLACALGGTCLWGLSFVVPLFLPGVSPWDVSLGRYLIFGLLGVLLVLRNRAAEARLTPGQWGWAFLFAATGYYGCYTAMVYAIGLSGAALPTLVLGLTPMSVAMVGNLRSREIPTRRLLTPLGLSCAGLAMANLARHGQGLSTRNIGLGLTASLAALALMTFYLVANIFFLKNNPKVKPLAWANAVGAATLAFSALALGARFGFGGGLPWQGTRTTAVAFLAGSAILGVGVSWFGGVLWNRANALLAPAVAGQCVVFWPISGIVYACLIDRKLPGPWEAAGMAMVFAGVLWGLSAVGSTGRESRAASIK